MDDFYLDIWHEDGLSTIVCRGELDVSTSNKLREAVSIALERAPTTLKLDCNGVRFLSAAGITVLVDSLVECRAAGTKLDLELSTQARRVLDIVGLWWLGIVEDGVAIHVSLQQALKTYAETMRADMASTPEEN
jgi:anti-sigma B factor antagonist